MGGADGSGEPIMSATPRPLPVSEEFKPAPVPLKKDLKTLRTAAADCRACPLWRNATCTVFGEGPRRPALMLVGEQPGDQEDRSGRPFVGPAGKLLDCALAEAQIDRGDVYVTNAVKHFKWTAQGKRRLHAKPNAREMAACRPWLDAEVTALSPSLIVCLGATAARQVLGREVKVTATRGQKLNTEWGMDALVTVHPSSLLRARGLGNGQADFAAFVEDLRRTRS